MLAIRQEGGRRGSTVRREFVGVQYLRALAALGVVIYHFQERVFGSTWYAWASGVDVFFVVSGFIIWQTTAGRTPWAWWKARFWRIVPLYWIGTTIMLATVVLGGRHLDWEHVARSYLFIPTMDHRGLMMPVLDVGWTLNYEMFFYTGMAAAMFLKRFRLVAIGAIFLGMMALRPLASEDGPVLFRLTSPITLEFLAGIAIAVALPYLRAWLAVVSLAAGLAFAVLASPALIPGPRTLHFGVPAALIVAGVVSLEAYMPRLSHLKLLGDASYSLYLSHLLTAIPLVWLAERFGIGGAPLFGGLLVLTTVAGVAVYWWVELPLVRVAART